MSEIGQPPVLGLAFALLVLVSLTLWFVLYMAN